MVRVGFNLRFWTRLETRWFSHLGLIEWHGRHGNVSVEARGVMAGVSTLLDDCRRRNVEVYARSCKVWKFELGKFSNASSFKGLVVSIDRMIDGRLGGDRLRRRRDVGSACKCTVVACTIQWSGIGYLKGCTSKWRYCFGLGHEIRVLLPGVKVNLNLKKKERGEEGIREYERGLRENW